MALQPPPVVLETKPVPSEKIMLAASIRPIPVVLSMLLLFAPAMGATEVHPRFDLSGPDGGPFPSDRFTVADPTQMTGLRVTLPKPDCLERASDCEDIDVINTLDGFNALLDAVRVARKAGVAEQQIAVATVFTTQSVIAVLEKIRDQIKAAAPRPCRFQPRTRRESDGLPTS